MVINGLLKLTLLDYPGHTACTVFTGGCNFRCPFCHNASLVVRAGEQPRISEEEFFSFLKKRQGLLDGVCVTGGEPTLQRDLGEFLSRIKALGFEVKLDTNGYEPEILEKIISGGLVDYVAMDIKSSPERYPEVAGVPGMDMEKIKKSAKLLMEGNVPFEFRTTVVEELHEASDFEDVGRWLRGAPRYFVQCYKDSGDILESGFSAPSEEKLNSIVEILNKYMDNVSLRGVD